MDDFSECHECLGGACKPNFVHWITEAEFRYNALGEELGMPVTLEKITHFASRINLIRTSRPDAMKNCCRLRVLDRLYSSLNENFRRQLRERTQIEHFG